jgi:hypothetical protein
MINYESNFIIFYLYLIYLFFNLIISIHTHVKNAEVYIFRYFFFRS